VLKKNQGNLFAANGIGILQADKAQWDIAKELFTQVHETTSGSIFVQVPDVWINLAHIYFAQGLFQQQLRRTKIVCGSSSATQMQLYSCTLPACPNTL
jgi:RNA polymerase-associated protein CTR9